MQKNMLGPHAYFLGTGCRDIRTFQPCWAALADDPQPTLYHVQESTFGCGDAASTRLLTDPSEPRRSNSSWMKTTISNGRCVTITPRSPWKLMSQDNGVALMEYAGTVGAPGSYYIASSELVDPVGSIPALAPLAQGTTSANTPAAAPNAAETALAPSPQDVPNTATPIAFHGNWSTWDVLLLLLAISIAGVVGYIVGRNTR